MATVYLLDEGDTQSSGKNSTFVQVWQTIGYANNNARRAAIVAHPSYFSSVTTADDVLLDNIEWNYARQQKNKLKVTLTYSHQESRRNKVQNTVLQNVGDEETRISFSSIEVPITEAIAQNSFGTSADIGNRINYNPQTKEVKGTKRRRLVSNLLVSKLYAEEIVDNDWILERENKLFTINNAVFRSRPAETVMFVGLDLNQRSVNGDWRVGFNFEFMPKETKDLSTLDIGSQQTIAIFPYRFYHATYEEKPDEEEKRLVPKCNGFYEAEIYEKADFSTLI